MMRNAVKKVSSRVRLDWKKAVEIGASEEVSQVFRRIGKMNRTVLVSMLQEEVERLA